jgi:hypothetical protein
MVAEAVKLGPTPTLDARALVRVFAPQLKSPTMKLVEQDVALILFNSGVRRNVLWKDQMDIWSHTEPEVLAQELVVSNSKH